MTKGNRQQPIKIRHANTFLTISTQRVFTFEIELKLLADIAKNYSDIIK